MPRRGGGGGGSEGCTCDGLMKLKEDVEYDHTHMIPIYHHYYHHHHHSAWRKDGVQA